MSPYTVGRPTVGGGLAVAYCSFYIIITEYYIIKIRTKKNTLKLKN
jgi:hypothetical protein